MRHSRRLMTAVMLSAFGSVLAGCGGGGISSFDPTDLLGFLDTKKKLPGERKPVFPEGVPGLEQGVPKDLYKGAAEERIREEELQQQQQAAEAAAAETKAQTKGGKTRRKTATVPEDQDAGSPDDEVIEAPPPKPAKRAPRPAARATAQQPQSPPAFPAPLPSGSFSR